MPPRKEWELPLPNRLYHSLGDATIEMDVYDNDDVSVVLNRPAGGRVTVELSMHWTYGGYQCAHVVEFDPEAARAVRDAINEALAEAED